MLDQQASAVAARLQLQQKQLLDSRSRVSKYSFQGRLFSCRFESSLRWCKSAATIATGTSVASCYDDCGCYSFIPETPNLLPQLKAGQLPRGRWPPLRHLRLHEHSGLESRARVSVAFEPKNCRLRLWIQARGAGGSQTNLWKASFPGTRQVRNGPKEKVCALAFALVRSRKLRP